MDVQLADYRADTLVLVHCLREVIRQVNVLNDCFIDDTFFLMWKVFANTDTEFANI